MRTAVYILVMIAFLVVLLIGYVATGGESIAGFVDYLLGAI